MGWWKRDKKPKTSVELRENIFRLQAAELGLAPNHDAPTVWGVVIDVSLGEMFYTLVTLGDRTTSLYFSNGGGIIGAGQHPEVAAAGRLCLVECDSLLDEFGPVANHDGPSSGQIRFWALTYDGVRGVTVSNADILASHSPLTRLFGRAQDTITEIRLRSPS